jgi:hypothetical protein
VFMMRFNLCLTLKALSAASLLKGLLRRQLCRTRTRYKIPYLDIKNLMLYRSNSFLNCTEPVGISAESLTLSPEHVSLNSAPNLGPLISCWELDKFKNCWNKCSRTSKIPKFLYQQFSNLLISQQDMSGPRLRALSNNMWSGGTGQE